MKLKIRRFAVRISIPERRWLNGGYLRCQVLAAEIKVCLFRFSSLKTGLSRRCHRGRRSNSSCKGVLSLSISERRTGAQRIFSFFFLSFPPFLSQDSLGKLSCSFFLSKGRSCSNMKERGIVVYAADSRPKKILFSSLLPERTRKTLSLIRIPE